MLPDIRAVIVTIMAATGLLIVAFVAVASFRVAQETRLASLQADLAQRGHAVTPQPRPIAVIETPGPTLLVKASQVEPEEQAASPEVPGIQQDEATPLVTAAFPDNSAIAEVLPERDFNNQPAVVVLAPALDVASAEEPAAGTSPSPAPRLAIGGPSPEEIAHATAQRKAAERARARKAAAEAWKAAAERARKARLARIARERRAARRAVAAQAKQQASSSTPQRGFGFNPNGSFNSAPFGNTFNNKTGTTNWR